MALSWIKEHEDIIGASRKGMKGRENQIENFCFWAMDREVRRSGGIQPCHNSPHLALSQAADLTGAFFANYLARVRT